MDRRDKRLVVTTSLRAGAGQCALAERLSREMGLPLVPRENRSLEQLLADYNAGAAVVVEAHKVIYTDGQIDFFFHPGMAGLRINEIRKGKNDQMIAAMDLKPGYSVLDCTLGLGSDAIVAAYVTGGRGRVVGLESSPVVSALVRHGMQTYSRAALVVREAMRRVEVRCADHRKVLAELPAESFDVVYFDPMFKRPILKSSGINALRPLADHRPLNEKVIEMATRVAAKRVVCKENREENRLAKLGFTRIEGAKNSPAVYGVIVKSE